VSAKVGIITDAYEATRIGGLLDYLKGKAEVKIYVEEELVLDSQDLQFDEDVFFTKGKGYTLLALARMAEEYGRDSGARVVNDSRSIWNTMHRFVHCTLLSRTGIRVPDHSFGPSGSARFEHYIVKNIIDQNHLRALHVLPMFGGSDDDDEVPRIDTAEEAGGGPRVGEFHLYQRVIESEYEYKVYGFGDQLLFYRQVPVARNPNKMESRVPIPGIPELRDMAIGAMKATGLRITSMDFLKEDGDYYLTDINPVPNFNYIEGGAEILGNYLLKLAI